MGNMQSEKYKNLGLSVEEKEKSRRSLSNTQQSPGSEKQEQANSSKWPHASNKCPSSYVLRLCLPLSLSHSSCSLLCLSNCQNASKRTSLDLWLNKNFHTLTFSFVPTGGSFLNQNACWSDNIKRASAPVNPSLVSLPTHRYFELLSLALHWRIYIYGIVSYAVDWFAQIVNKKKKKKHSIKMSKG